MHNFLRRSPARVCSWNSVTSQLDSTHQWEGLVCVLFYWSKIYQSPIMWFVLFYVNSLKFVRKGFSTSKEFAGSKDRGGPAVQQLWLCWKNARARAKCWGAFKEEGELFLESRSSRQDKVGREVLKELGSFDPHVYKETYSCGGAEKGQDSRRENGAWVQETSLFHCPAASDAMSIPSPTVAQRKGTRAGECATN